MRVSLRSYFLTARLAAADATQNLRRRFSDYAEASVCIVGETTEKQSSEWQLII
jgi:hypothetical protein